VLVPALAALVPWVPVVYKYLIVDTTAMIVTNIVLYQLLQKYVTGEKALIGIVGHAITFPVLYYFYAVLTDTVCYMIVVIVLYMIYDERIATMLIIPVIAVGVVVRETILITLPLLMVMRIRKEPAQVVIGIIEVGLVYMVIYGQGSIGVLRMPNPLWWVYVVASVAPFIPFIMKWKVSRYEIVYSGTVIAYAVIALFFAYFDGRFLVYGYPVWIGLTLQAVYGPANNHMKATKVHHA